MTKSVIAIECDHVLCDENSMPIEQSIECITKLLEKYDLYIVTSRDAFTTAMHTKEWLDKHYGKHTFMKIIHTFNKVTTCKEQKIDVLIDATIDSLTRCTPYISHPIYFNSLSNDIQSWKNIENLLLTK